MALNWRDLPEGEAPASSQPVFQNIGAAGAQWEGLKDIGAAVGRLGEIHEQYRQREMSQNAAYYNQLLDDALRQQEIDARNASTNDSLSNNPEAPIQQAQAFKKNSLLPLGEQIAAARMTDFDRRQLGERLRSAEQLSLGQGQFVSGQWVSKSKQLAGQASFERMAAEGHGFTDADRTRYDAIRTDLSPEMREEAWRELLHGAHVARSQNFLAAVQDSPASLKQFSRNVLRDPELTAQERASLSGKADEDYRREQNRIDSANQQQANKLARVSLRQSLSFLRTARDTSQLETLQTALLSGEQKDIDAAIIAMLPPKVSEDVRNQITGAFSSLDEDGRLQLFNQVAYQGQQLSSAQDSKAMSLQGDREKGTLSSALVRAVAKEGKISPEQEESLLTQLDNSWYVTANAGDLSDINGRIDAAYYDVFRRHFGEDASKITAGLADVEIPSGLNMYDDTQGLIDEVMESYPSAEGRYRAVQNLITLQIIDRANGDLKDAGWAYFDKSVPADVNTRTQSILAKLLSLSTTSTLGPRELGARFRRVTEESMRIAKLSEADRSKELDALEAATISSAAQAGASGYFK